MKPPWSFDLGEALRKTITSRPVETPNAVMPVAGEKIKTGLHGECFLSISIIIALATGPRAWA